MDTDNRVDTSKMYFAQLREKELAAAILEKVTTYERYVSETGLLSIWQSAYRLWYSQDDQGFTAHMIGKKGPKGKYAVLKFNHFRSIVKNWRSLASSQGSAMQPAVKFSGWRSDEQVKRARILLDHFWDTEGISSKHDEAVGISAYLGACHLEQTWDPTGGEVVVPDADEVVPPTPELPNGAASLVPPGPQPVDPGMPAGAGGPASPPMDWFSRPKPATTGTIVPRIYTPIDAIVDPRRMDADSPWIVTRHYENKWDVASRWATDQAQFDKIVGLSRPKNDKLTLELNFAPKNRDGQSDDIPVYTLWHDRTPACPEGLRAVCLNAELLLESTTLGKLKQKPVRRIAPGDILRTPFGYSEAWDLIAPQLACDILTSISLSSIRSYGLGSVLATKNSGLSSTDIADGLKLLEYNYQGPESKPDVLKLPSVPTDVWRGQESWVKQMGTLIGVNGVTRGDPEKSLESGSALALVQAQSVQFSSDFQAQIIDFKKGSATDTICLTQAFLKAEMEFPITGDEIADMDKFSGNDVDHVIRVDVKAVNPMTKTMGGRFQLADFLASKFPNQVTPRQMLNMISQGSLDPIVEDVETEERNIARENAMLAKGIGPPPMVLDPITGQPALNPATGEPMRQAEPGQTYVVALISDDPMRHVKRHLSLLDSPSRRNDPNVVKAVLDHVQEHERLYAMLTAERPALLQIMGLPPLQAAMPPAEGDPSAGGGKPPAGPGGGAEKGGGVRPSVQSKANDPQGSAKMPKFPSNPATGERYRPAPTPGEKQCALFPRPQHPPELRRPLPPPPRLPREVSRLQMRRKRLPSKRPSLPRALSA